MNLAKFTGPGSTPSRRRFWNNARDTVISLQKVAGRNVSVDEHPGKGTVINVQRGGGGGGGGGVDCCPRTPHHMVADVTMTVAALGFEDTFHYDDANIADTFCPDCVCGGSPGGIIDTTGGGDGTIQHLQSIIYILYDSGTDLWYVSTTAIALDASFNIIASCSTSFDTGASGCGLDESFTGPDGIISGAVLDYSAPFAEVGTGTLDAVFT